MKVYVGGVNAVGKSTLLRETAKKLNYQYIHATSGLLEYLGFAKDYEKLRALTQKERDVKLREYIEKLLKSKRTDFLLDSHYLGLVRGKVDRVTDSWLQNFDAFVLISAPLDDIWKRIENDSKTRDRALFPSGISEDEMKEILATYQKQTSEEFKRLADFYKKPRIEIINSENKLEESVLSLVEFIK